MQKIILLVLVIATIFHCSAQTTQEKDSISSHIDTIDFPKPIGYVNDYAFILDSFDIIFLETKLKLFDYITTNQIAIITLNNDKLTEENFDKYALELSNYWGVGTNEKNNGLTIVLSPKLRKIRINTGSGTKKIITDAICDKILQTIIIPELKTQNYFRGLNKATDELIKLWK